jgi:hypothetical protein
LVDINCKVAYEEIIKELAKCNCEADFKDFIINNERLYYRREEFNWLLDKNVNPILKLNLECYFDTFLHEYIIDNKKNHKEYYNYENNLKKTFYTKFIRNIKKEFLFDKYNLLCLEQIYKDFTEIRYEKDPFGVDTIYWYENEVYPNIDSNIDYNTILYKDNKALFLKKYEDVSNNKTYKEIFDRIPNIKKNEILRIIYDIHYYIIELLKVEGLKINRIVNFKDFIFEKYVIDYLLQYDERYKELEKKFLNCFLLNLSGEWNEDRESLKVNATTITEQNETIKEQKENINKKESVKEISEKVQNITASNLKKYENYEGGIWDYIVLGVAICTLILLLWKILTGSIVARWDLSSYLLFAPSVLVSITRMYRNYKNINKDNKDNNYIGWIWNYIFLGISILGSIGGAVGGYYFFTKDGKDFSWVQLFFVLKIIVPLAILGYIAYRNINRNRFLKEEYQHKDTIMRLFNVFRDDDEVKDEIKKTMLEMIKENPNDKILRNENHHNKWLKKFIKNSQEVLKIYTKNKNGNVKD